MPTHDRSDFNPTSINLHHRSCGIPGIDLTVSLQISDVLYEKIVAVAEAQNLSVEAFMILAAAEKLAATMHHEWLKGGKSPDLTNPCGEV